MNNQLPEYLYELKTIERIEHYATKALEILNSKSPDQSTPGQTLVNKIKELFPEHGINESTIWQYLSIIASSSDSKINKPGRNKGFYLVDTLDSNIKEEPLTEETKKNFQREKELYKLFSDWLLSKGVKKVKDTSNLKNQDLGYWGNPDITGIIPREILGELKEIEILTLEIKYSQYNWKQNIFEAVAHKRLSNRCYFCFAHQEDLISKIDADIRYYAEIYRIGILVLPMEEKDFIQLTTGIIPPNNELLKDYTSLDIIEYVSAPLDNTHFHFRDRFLSSIGVKKISELYDWGISR